MTKVVQLSDDAYQRLKARKRKGESFSSVVRRLTSTNTLGDLVGTMSPAHARRAKETIRQADEHDRP